MRKEVVLMRVVLAVFVLAGLIFAGTQSQDVILGYVIGAIGVINSLKEFFDIKGNIGK